MTNTEAPSHFDPFGIEAAKASQKPHSSSRRPVLMAVGEDKKKPNDRRHAASPSHHSQRYAENHAAQSPPAVHKSPSRTTHAGRLQSAEQQHASLVQQQQQQQQPQPTSNSMDSTLDPFGIAAFTAGRPRGGDATQSSSSSSLVEDESMQHPQSLERRLDAARTTLDALPVLDPETMRPRTSTTTTTTTGGSKQQARTGTTVSHSSNHHHKAAAALPPKMTVKLTLSEEVSALALEMVASQIAVEGTVLAQVQCSDALKNAPFVLAALKPPPHDDTMTSLVKLRPDPQTTSLEPIAVHHEDDDETHEAYLVQVPKSDLGYTPVLHYSFSQVVEHMPILLERKVTIHDTSCRIALQVRSKLTNKGDLKDFTLVVAIPEVVDADSIEIVRGEGSYDPLKRLIKFQLDSLNKGESFMVSAQAKLWKAITGNEVRFPVLLRCSSTEDQISTVDFKVQEADGTPCYISVTKSYSFRLLHRLT